MKYLIVCILILQISIPILCIIFYVYISNKKRRIELFSNNISDSEMKHYNDSKERSKKGTHTTFTNFHFHAADMGFLLIGDFLLQWGMGGNVKYGRRTGYFVKPFNPSNGMGVITVSVGDGGGQHTLRIKSINKKFFELDDAGDCEKTYLFLAYGFVDVYDHDRGVKITYNRNQEHLFPKRLQFLADNNVRFESTRIMNKKNSDRFPGGC